MLSTATSLPTLEPLASTQTPAGAARTVLLVEDEESLADLLQHLLGRLQLRVLHAADGARALQLLMEHRDEVVLAFVDCHLPDTSGGLLCEALRDCVPGLPLLLTSGRDQRVLESQFAPGGPCSFLPKPYMPTEVGRRVSALLPAAS